MPDERRVDNIMEALGEEQFLFLLLLNLIIVILYLFLSFVLKICRRKTNVKGVWLKSTVMLLCPVVGVCFFSMGYLCNKVIFHAKVDLNDVIFSKERVRPRMAAEEESESNIVPIEEAVAITDKDSLRGMIMNVVRGNMKSSLSAVSLALGSDDPETAHYAEQDPEVYAALEQADKGTARLADYVRKNDRLPEESTGSISPHWSEYLCRSEH